MANTSLRAADAVVADVERLVIEELGASDAALLDRAADTARRG